MKLFILPLLFMVSVSFSGQAEQQQPKASTNVDCDQQALVYYNRVLEKTGNQNKATETYQDEFWDCMDDGGMSDSTIYIEG